MESRGVLSAENNDSEIAWMEKVSSTVDLGQVVSFDMNALFGNSDHHEIEALPTRADLFDWDPLEATFKVRCNQLGIIYFVTSSISKAFPDNRCDRVFIIKVEPVETPAL